MVFVDTAELAAWLIEHGERLWSVDGESRLEGELSLPCPAEDLAVALKRRGGQLVVDPPPDAQLAGSVRRDQLDKAAWSDGYGRAFRVKWREGDGAGDPWLLVEDALAEASNG